MLKIYNFPRFTRPQQKGLFLFSLVVFIFLGFQYWGLGRKPDREIKNPQPGRGITVELCGKVKRPGLLTYSQPPTVKQVIRDAGGLLSDRGLSSTGETTVLKNDLSLTVLQNDNGEVLLQPGPLSGKALWILGQPIPLNRATDEDLSRLPGVGSTLAVRIIEYREAHGGFSSLEQLKEIKGIKEKTFEKIKGHFVL
jgi:competence protein ComEA